MQEIKDLSEENQKLKDKVEDEKQKAELLREDLIKSAKDLKKVGEIYSATTGKEIDLLEQKALQQQAEIRSLKKLNERLQRDVEKRDGMNGMKSHENPALTLRQQNQHKDNEISGMKESGYKSIFNL